MKSLNIAILLYRNYFATFIHLFTKRSTYDIVLGLMIDQQFRNVSRNSSCAQGIRDQRAVQRLVCLILL